MDIAEAVEHSVRCIEQREGRMIRQGNQYKTVEVFRYVTEGTFDAYMWGIIENKQRFISQIMTGKSPVRTCEDIDETTLSFAVRPVIRAVDALQSPKPSGANIGANRLPSIASKLFSALSATLSRMSNVCRNHITIDAAKITVNAFWIKSFAFSHIS